MQGRFKAVLVENEEQLIHTSRYIHLNPIVSGPTNNLIPYRWSSYQEFVGPKNGICAIQKVLSHFPSKEDYKKFVTDQIDYATSLELIKHQMIEEY